MTCPRALPALALALALGGCGSAPVPDPRGPEPTEWVYVTNQDDATVTVFDAATGQVRGTVDLQEVGFAANAKPHHVAVEPDGSFWYVSLIGANAVVKLDASDRVVGRAELEVPGMLALDPSSDRLYVGRSMSAVNPPRSIGVIRRTDMALEEIAVLYPRPHALAASPITGLAYSASLAENRMAIVDAIEEDVELRELPVPAGHEGHEGMGGEMEGMVHTVVDFAVSPDGSTLVATGEMSRELLVFDLSDPWVPRLTHQVPVESRPWHPRFSPDGRWVWFANKGADAVTVVDARSWTVADVIRGEGLAEPHGLAISSDGSTVFVSSNNLQGTVPGGVGTVVVIDAATRAIERVHPVGRNPTGVGGRAWR